MAAANAVANIISELLIPLLLWLDQPWWLEQPVSHLNNSSTSGFSLAGWHVLVVLPCISGLFGAGAVGIFGEDFGGNGLPLGRRGNGPLALHSKGADVVFWGLQQQDSGLSGVLGGGGDLGRDLLEVAKTSSRSQRLPTYLAVWAMEACRFCRD